MRELLFASAAAAMLGVAGPAVAQSDDYWTGFYLGGSIGASWGDTSTKTSGNPGNGPVVIPPVDLAVINALGASSGNKTGFIGGGEGGFNFLFGSVLLGLETDLSFFDVNQSKANTFTSALAINPPVQETLTQHLTTDWLWTLRTRVGFTGGPWLVYATGGVASSKIKYSVAFSDTRNPRDVAQQSFSDTKTGWVAGLGGAYALAPNWSVKGEYLYTDLGDIRGTLTTPTGFVTLTSQAKVKANILRVGVDYRF
jgi:outer membrane immunogenic protein